MSDDRTPHWLIQLRLLLLCSPAGILLAIVLAPWAIPVLVVFCGTVLVFSHAARLFTNGFVKALDPEAYEAIKANGGDPFYDSLGAPLNTDSDAVRIYGYEPNVICPACGLPLRIQFGQPTSCPSCNAQWHNDCWWRWDGLDRQQIGSA